MCSHTVTKSQAVPSGALCLQKSLPLHTGSLEAFTYLSNFLSFSQWLYGQKMNEMLLKLRPLLVAKTLAASVDEQKFLSLCCCFCLGKRFRGWYERGGERIRGLDLQS